MLNSRINFGPARIPDEIFDRPQSAARKNRWAEILDSRQKKCYKILYRLLQLPLQTVDA
jgi:hypothetical protein